MLFGKIFFVPVLFSFPKRGKKWNIQSVKVKWLHGGFTRFMEENVSDSIFHFTIRLYARQTRCSGFEGSREIIFGINFEYFVNILSRKRSIISTLRPVCLGKVEFRKVTCQIRTAAT